MSDTTPAADPSDSIPNPPAWAQLVCPFRSSSHMIVERPQQVQLSGIQAASVGGKIQIIPADLPCLGPACAIFYSCKPGVLEVAVGGEGMGG